MKRAMMVSLVLLACAACPPYGGTDGGSLLSTSDSGTTSTPVDAGSPARTTDAGFVVSVDAGESGQ